MTEIAKSVLSVEVSRFESVEYRKIAEREYLDDGLDALDDSRHHLQECRTHLGRSLCQYCAMQDSPETLLQF